jgi:hypothetical protein
MNNLISVSNCAAIFCAISISGDAQSKRLSRFLSIALFAALYLAFVIVFGVRLNQWDYKTTRMCYNTKATSHSTDAHPWADRVYLGITCSFFYVALSGALMFEAVPLNPMTSSVEEEMNERSTVVLTLVMLQFPVHLYFVIALRATNQSLLQGGSEESSWGFGQTVAMVMLGGTLIECCKGLKGMAPNVLSFIQC